MSQLGEFRPPPDAGTVVGPASWLAEPHYRKADRLYVFNGQASALRHGIDPKWRGMTPYLALFGRSGEPKFVVGKPSPAEMAALLSP